MNKTHFSTLNDTNRYSRIFCTLPTASFSSSMTLIPCGCTALLVKMRLTWPRVSLPDCWSCFNMMSTSAPILMSDLSGVPNSITLRNEFCLGDPLHFICVNSQYEQQIRRNIHIVEQSLSDFESGAFDLMHIAHYFLRVTAGDM